MGRSRARWGGEAGVTLVELSIAASLMLVVLVVFGTQLTTALRATTTVSEEAEAVDLAKTALDRIEREVRGAARVVSPAGGAAGTALEMTTWTGSDGHLRWVRYSVDGDGVLTRADGGDGYAAAADWGEPVELAHHVEGSEVFRFCPRTADEQFATVVIDLPVRFDPDRGARRLVTEVGLRNTTGTTVAAAGACS